MFTLAPRTQPDFSEPAAQPQAATRSGLHLVQATPQPARRAMRPTSYLHGHYTAAPNRIRGRYLPRVE